MSISSHIPHQSKSSAKLWGMDRLLMIILIAIGWSPVLLIEKITPPNVLNLANYPAYSYIFWFIAFGTWLYFILIFFAQRRIHKGKQKLPPIPQAPHVTILIPTHNESTVIANTLRGILKIDYPNYHVTVIDDRSTDGTQDIVHNLMKESPYAGRLQIIERTDPTRAGKSHSLNDAIAQINDSTPQTEYYLMVDADAIPEPECLNKAIRYFYVYSDIGAVQFQKQTSNADYNLLTKCQDHEMSFDTYLQSGRDALNGFVEIRGNGMLISKKVLDAVGKWDPSSLTEDLEMSLRMQMHGWRIKFAPEISIYEEGVITIRDLFKQRFRWAEGSIRRFLKHIANGNLNPFSPKFYQTEMTLVQKLDIAPMILQFSLPLWMAFGFGIQLYRMFTHQSNCLAFMGLAYAVFFFVMYTAGVAGIRYWRQRSWSYSLFWAFISLSYAMLHWTPVVVWVVRRIIFGRGPSAWVKTPRLANQQAERIN